LWDNCSVLIDTERLYFESTRESLLETEFELTEDLFKTISFKESHSFFDLAAVRYITAKKISILRQKRNILHLNLLRSGVQPIYGVEHTLRMFSGRACMGVITISRRESCIIVEDSERGLILFFAFLTFNTP